jgi:hypothetical protein
MPVRPGMVTQQLAVREGNRTGAVAHNVVQLVVVDSSWGHRKGDVLSSTRMRIFKQGRERCIFTQLGRIFKQEGQYFWQE